MSAFTHRFVWDTEFVCEKLRSHSLSETASFGYFLTIMAFDWLQFTVIATTQTPKISEWSSAGAWITFAITVIGLMYIFWRNGGANGNSLLYRYFPLSVTVGWKFVIVGFVVASLVPLALSGFSMLTVGWATTFALGAVNVLMFCASAPIWRRFRGTAKPNPRFERTRSIWLRRAFVSFWARRSQMKRAAQPKR